MGFQTLHTWLKCSEPCLTSFLPPQNIRPTSKEMLLSSLLLPVHCCSSDTRLAGTDGAFLLPIPEAVI